MHDSRRTSLEVVLELPHTCIHHTPKIFLPPSPLLPAFIPGLPLLGIEQPHIQGCNKGKAVVSFLWLPCLGADLPCSCPSLAPLSDIQHLESLPRPSNLVPLKSQQQLQTAGEQVGMLISVHRPMHSLLHDSALLRHFCHSAKRNRFQENHTP